MEIAERIVHTASLMFERLGIRSVSMDDISRSLGMSKKTLYQHFKDKDSIVVCFCQRHRKEWQQELTAIETQSPTALHEIVNLTKHLKVALSKMNPGLLHDMQKYHPAAFQEFLESKQSEMLPTIIRVINRGKQEGVFRQDLNPEILGRMRMEQIELSTNPAVFPPDKFNLLEVNLQLLEHFVSGMLTVEGMKAYQALKASQMGDESVPFVPSTAPPY